MRLCEFPGCGRKHLSRGMCSTHYSQWERGEALSEPRPRLVRPETGDLVALAFSNSTPCPETGCWFWVRGSNPSGYARARINGEYRLLGRALLGLSADDERYACHHCDLPPCVNPAHLYAGTPSQNVRDAVTRGRWRQADVTRARWEQHRRAT